MNRYIRTTAVLSASVLLAALAACSGGGGGTPNAPGTGAGGTASAVEPTGEVQFAFWGGEQRVKRSQAVIDLFQKAHPGVKVTPTATGDFNAYWQQATVQASGSNMACVPQMQNRTLADYADRGALMPLDDLVTSGAIDTTNIPKAVVDSGRGKDGKLYMIGYGAAFGSLMVDTTAIKDLGLELPPDGYTWDWLATWLDQIVKKTGKPAINVFGQISDELEAWARTHGENLYNNDGTVGLSADQLAAFWDYSMALIKSATSQSAQQAVEQQSLPIEQQPISQGKVPVFFWPANAVATVQKTLDQVSPGHVVQVYPMPSGKDGVPGNALWVSGLSIAKNCKNVNAAASFINFWLNDKEGALAFQSDNGATTNTANLAALLVDSDVAAGTKAQLTLYQKLSGMNLPASYYGKGMAQVFQKNLITAFQQVSFGQTSTQDGATQFVQAAKKAVEG